MPLWHPCDFHSRSKRGYEISSQFNFECHPASSDDYSYILTALSGLASATDNPKVKYTLEKISHLHPQKKRDMLLDFSVLREGEQSTLQMLQTSIKDKCCVIFLYTNNDNISKCHTVEPIALLYRWYAWYLLAYSKEKNDYRTYKLARIRNLKISDIPFSREHNTPENILKECDKRDCRQYTELLIKCKEKAQVRVHEYLKGLPIETYPDGDILMKVTVVENEYFWFAALLALGDDVEVISPEKIRCLLVQTAKKIISPYK